MQDPDEKVLNTLLSKIKNVRRIRDTIPIAPDAIVSIIRQAHS
jgi:hypothetical protein